MNLSGCESVFKPGPPGPSNYSTFNAADHHRRPHPRKGKPGGFPALRWKKKSAHIPAGAHPRYRTDFFIRRPEKKGSMKFSASDLRMRVWASAALIASAAMPIAAGITIDQYATPYMVTTSYVDFAASSTVAGHWNYSLFNTAEHYHSWASKYFDIAITATDQYAPLGSCVEIATLPPAAGIVTDTEILVKLPDNPVWQRLSDDYAGTRYSRARLWFGEGFVNPVPAVVRVAAYHPNYNSGDFKFSYTHVLTSTGQPITTEADCFADAGIAAAFINRHEQVFIRRAI
jgi:hypothetical protein